MGGKGDLDINDLTKKEQEAYYRYAQEFIDSGELSLDQDSSVMMDYPNYGTESGYGDIYWGKKNLGLTDEKLESWKKGEINITYPGGRDGAIETYSYDEWLEKFPGTLDVGGQSIGDLITNMQDSNYVAKTLTGKADINYDKDSNTITVTDKYNHNRNANATNKTIIESLIADPSLYALLKSGALLKNADGSVIELDLGSPEFVKNYDTTYASGGPVTGLRKKLKQRQGFKSGSVSGVVQRLIERGGEAMGIGASEQRANEKQAAAIVNQMVADGTIPKYEYVEVDDFGFRSGKTGDVFEAVNHGLLSATYGDYALRRGALQLKEIGQGFSRPLDSKRDSYNNRVGFKIRETAKTPEEITREINNRIIRSYEKMNSGEALIPGEDFFLNPNEMEL
jgi:hypothetical protein